MRYALVSDLHANLQAWKAVLLDIRSNKADHIICLGDVVGYGPSPAEVLESAHENIHSFVMGNHDAVICGKLNDNLFNDGARESIRRTRLQLGASAAGFLSSFPLMLDGGRFLCAHGDFTAPEAFNYVLDPADAAECWRSVDHPLLFIGHTHTPGLYILGESGTPHAIQPQDFELEPGKRYLVNVGSVGSSRDCDHRASYCIYDTKGSAVFWRRIPYDLDAHRREYEQQGLDPAASTVLNADPRRGTVPLRERLDFSPPTSPESAVIGVTELVSLRQMRRRTLLWRIVAAILFSILAAAGAMAGLWWQRQAVRPVIIGASSMPALTLNETPKSRNILPPLSLPVKPDAPIPHWTASLGDARCQTFGIGLEADGTPVAVLSSRYAQTPIHIMPAPIRVAPGMTFYPDVMFSKSTDFAGSVSVTVTLMRAGGKGATESQQFYIQEPGTPRSDGWAHARRKFTIPADGQQIQIRIGGRFTGTVKIRHPTLGYNPR